MFRVSRVVLRQRGFRPGVVFFAVEPTASNRPCNGATHSKQNMPPLAHPGYRQRLPTGTGVAEGSSRAARGHVGGCSPRP